MATKTEIFEEIAATIAANTRGSLLDPSFQALRETRGFQHSFYRYRQTWVWRLDEMTTWLANSGDIATFNERSNLAYWVYYTTDKANRPEVPQETLAAYVKTLQTYFAPSNTFPQEIRSGIDHHIAQVAGVIFGIIIENSCPQWIIDASMGINPELTSNIIDNVMSNDPTQRANLQPLITALYRHHGNLNSNEINMNAILTVAGHSSDPQILNEISNSENFDTTIARELFRNESISDQNIADAIRAAGADEITNMLSRVMSANNAGTQTHAAVFEILTQMTPHTNSWAKTLHYLLSTSQAEAAWSTFLSTEERGEDHLKSYTQLFIAAALSTELPARERMSALDMIDLKAALPSAVASLANRLSEQEPLSVEVAAHFLAITQDHVQNGNGPRGTDTTGWQALLATPGIPESILRSYAVGRGNLPRAARIALKVTPDSKATELKPVPVGNWRAFQTALGGNSYGNSKPSMDNPEDCLNTIMGVIVGDGDGTTRRIAADIFANIMSGNPDIIPTVPPEVIASMRRFHHPFEFSSAAIAALMLTPEGSELASRQIQKALRSA